MGCEDGLTATEREELRQLHRRVKRLKQERDILKRAAVLSQRRPRPGEYLRIISAERDSFPVLCRRRSATGPAPALPKDSKRQAPPALARGRVPINIQWVA